MLSELTVLHDMLQLIIQILHQQQSQRYTSMYTVLLYVIVAKKFFRFELSVVQRILS